MAAAAQPRFDRDDVLRQLNVAAFYGARLKIRWAGDNGSTRCPFHDDRNPSFSIAKATGLFNCHGCGAHGSPIDFLMQLDNLSFQDALAAVARFSAARPTTPHGATRPAKGPSTSATASDADNSDDNNGQRFRLEDAAAVYDYHDADGIVLYRVARYVPKTFRPFRPSGDGWVQGLRDTPRVLYRLPQVLAAKAAGAPIYLVEGEKDADALNAAEDGGEYVATTWAGGADGWAPHKDRYLEQLDGAKRVVIVRDKDGPDEKNPRNSFKGQKLAARVYAALRTRVRRVEVVEAVAGKDAYDHLQAGHGRHQFIFLTEREILEPLRGEPDAPPPPAQPLPTLGPADLFAIQVPDVDWIMPGWARQDIHLVAAPGGTSKSLYTFAVALALASGTPILGQYECRRTRVLVIQEEDPPDVSTLRVQRMARGMGLSVADLDGWIRFTPFRAGFCFGNTEHYAGLRALLQEWPAEILFVDSLSQVSTMKQNETHEVRAFFRDHVLPIANEFHAGLTLVHHTNKLAYQKQPTVETVGTITGSTSFVNCCDSVALIQGVPRERDHRQLSFVKVRRFARPSPFIYQIFDLDEPGPMERRAVRLLYERAIETEIGETITDQDRVIQTLRDNPGQWFTVAQLVDLAKCTDKTVRRALAKAAAKDEIREHPGTGGPGAKKRYSAPQE